MKRPGRTPWLFVGTMAGFLIGGCLLSPSVISDRAVYPLGTVAPILCVIAGFAVGCCLDFVNRKSR